MTTSRPESRAVALVAMVACAVAGMLGTYPAAAQPTPAPRCDVDVSAPQIAAAVSTLRPAFADDDTRWNPVPYGGNFDTCAALSTVLVTVERATGSSPDHALFFHYGQYLGTATWNPYPFTELNAEQTTDDTVVLDYKLGGDVCTACPAPIYPVRYRWTGDHVDMMDAPPPTP